MICVPKSLVPLRDQLINSFSRPATAKRMMFLMLALAAILVTSSRAIANLLRLIGFLDRINPSTYP